MHADFHPGSSCREAVATVLAEQAAAGQPMTSSADPSGYCQGRRRLPLSLFRQGLQQVSRCLQEKSGTAHRWCGHRVWIVDGSSCSMPDTAALQQAFSQPDRQRKGCGFPVAKVVAMFCWATGAIYDIAIGKYRSSELQLWQRLWYLLKMGGVVLADRFYGAYAYLAALRQKGCDGVFRVHAARRVDFRQGQRIGKHERQVIWSRPVLCPRGMSESQWLSLPETLPVRLLRFSVTRPGFRSRTIMVVTTLLDPIAYPAAQIASLYRDRWTVELRLRDLKTTLHMDILRGRSPEIVRKEIYMNLIVYNLIRALMWQAAEEHHRPLHRLSFAGTLQHVHALMPYLWLLAHTPRAATLYELLLV